MRLLGRAPPPEALPFLMLRTADWVSQVRICAEIALEAYYRDHSYADLLPALEVALEIESRSFARTIGARALRELVGKADDAFANTGKLSPGERANLLPRALSDRLGFVRRAALQAVPLREVPQAALEGLLIDSSRAIREEARRELERRSPGISSASIYRGLLASTRATDRALGLTGLAEVAGDEDAAEAVVRLEDASCRVRLAALRCLDRLAPNDAEEAALAALNDSARKVVALAAAISARHPSSRVQLAAEKLIASSDTFRHRVGMRLLKAGSVEHQVEVLAALLAEPLTQGEALAALDKCVSSRLVGGRELPGALGRRLADAISRCRVPEDWHRQRLEERQRQRILFALRSSAA